MRDLNKLKKLEFAPGTDYLYANYSPILLIGIVEKITNQNFSDYAKENLFAPFALNNMVIKASYPYEDKKFMAIPFNKEFEEDDYKISVSSVLFISTAVDLLRWFEKLDTFKIINRESVKFLSETAKTDDNIQSPLGFAEWKNGKLVEHSHHGSTANYECVVRRFKDDGLTIIVLTNQKHGNVYEISDKIREIVNSAKLN